MIFQICCCKILKIKKTRIYNIRHINDDDDDKDQELG